MCTEAVVSRATTRGWHLLRNTHTHTTTAAAAASTTNATTAAATITRTTITTTHHTLNGHHLCWYMWRTEPNINNISIKYQTTRIFNTETFFFVRNAAASKSTKPYRKQHRGGGRVFSLNNALMLLLLRHDDHHWSNVRQRPASTFGRTTSPTSNNDARCWFDQQHNRGWSSHSSKKKQTSVTGLSPTMTGPEFLYFTPFYWKLFFSKPTFSLF